MTKKLVILESPGKVKAISKYLGKDYKVVASNGHVIDLPQKELGVDVEHDFKPKYKVISNGSSAKILKDIETLAKKSEKILIATDPDREGEAIGWHIANRIKKYNDNIARVSFNEITKRGIAAGIKNEGEINQDLVDAQQARRILDRLVGYKVSPFLWKIITNGLSAGRVQSVALRIICERDKEIADFKTEEYWSIKADFGSTKEEVISAELLKFNGKNIEIKNEEEALKMVEQLQKEQYSIENINKKKIKKSPPPPFITSTLLQESFKKLGFSSKKTMQIAQSLYEGVDLGREGIQGLITYMRTDSIRVSEEAIDLLRNYLLKNYGKDFISTKKRKFKSKKNVQDAHEAIRPTDIDLKPKRISSFLTADQLKLYELIWNRFASTQMKEAVYEQTVIDITGGDYLFRVSGRILVAKGYLQVLKSDSDLEKTENLLPNNLDVGEKLKIVEVFKNQHFTKPPAHYNEASITKELEDKEIGRPSTYATIITKLIAQKYIEKQERRLISTELGVMVNRLLIENFPDLFNVEFTKKMESELDSIEYGKSQWVEIVKKFYNPFDEHLTDVMKRKKEIKEEAVEEVGKDCPQCENGKLIYKWGKNGKFIACNNFPDCKYTSSIEEANGAGDGASKKELVVVGKCKKCGGDLVVRFGRYGKFIACNNFPKCRNIVNEEMDVDCPKEGCDGKIIQRKSKRGKRFYGCSNYPTCDFVSWNKPIAEKCPACGFKVMGEVVDLKTKTVKKVCPSCKYEVE